MGCFFSSKRGAVCCWHRVRWRHGTANLPLKCCYRVSLQGRQTWRTGRTASCPAAVSAGQSSELLLKILTKLEEVRQTVNAHTATMETILVRLNASEESMAAALPAGLAFPLESYTDVESVEEKLQDMQTNNTLVCRNNSIHSLIVTRLLFMVLSSQEASVRLHSVHLKNADWAPVRTNSQTNSRSLGCDLWVRW